MISNQSNVVKDDEYDIENFILTKFDHLDEVNTLIDTLDSIIGCQNSEEKWEDRLQYIFNLYQDQPHLLDPCLEILLQKCIKLIGKPTKIERRESFIFRLIYLITKTRGYKTVIKLMPHEVSDLEPVLLMLLDLNAEDNENWQSRYVLLLWLSMVTIIPFDMSLLDSPDKVPITDRIIETGKRFLHSKDVSQIAAAFMLSKFICRPDAIQKGLLHHTVHWAVDEIPNIKMENIAGHNFMCGLLRFFTYLFKFGKREDLLEYSTVVLEVNNKINTIQWDREILLCRLRTKLVQRIGLIFLKMRVISWRYQRGNRILMDTLKHTTDKSQPDKSGNVSKEIVPSQEMSVEDDDENFEVSEYLDEVIDFLINSLKNFFTVVRWSAAKGLGRICCRLPMSLADDVVEAILALFSRLETFSSWHGGCLALAELGRRGLLLPQRLPQVVPLLLSALVYDEKSGEYSYGANVRDAACYVCWAFARAYRPEELRPHVVDVARALVMVTLFDREVNVRRAASAAFQENVGRQGQFPHGIEILTTCDYFSVGNSSNCFLNLSVFIASFEEYVIHMIDHLVTLKVGHWDYDIRDLTSKALHKLYPFASDYMIKSVLPTLITACTGMDLYRRQGAIMCVGELMLAIDDVTTTVPESVKTDVKNLVTTLEKRMQFRGLSGELMRRAVCHLIYCCAEAKLNFDDDPVIEIWYKFLMECTVHKEKLVRAASVEAFPKFLEYFALDTSGSLKDSLKNTYINEVCEQIRETTTQYIQITNLTILGKTPKLILISELNLADIQSAEGSRRSIPTFIHIIRILLQASKCDVPKAAKWGEARSYAVTALIDVCEAVFDQSSLTNSLLLEILTVLLQSLEDYSFDSHGDIGALLREAAMRQILRLVQMIMSSEDENSVKLLDEEICYEIMTRVAQQAMEKIDRVRRTAGSVFYELVHLEPKLPHIPQHETLKRIFDKKECELLYWAAPQLTFPLFCQLLQFDEYRYRGMLGLVISVGGMTEKTVQQSRDALHSVIRSHEDDADYLLKLARCLVHIFNVFDRQDRVICPLLKSVDFMLADPVFGEFLLGSTETDAIKVTDNTAYANGNGNDCMNNDGDNEDEVLDETTLLLLQIIDCTKTEIATSKEVQKIKSGIEVFCTMLQFSEIVWRKAMGKLMILLGHRFPIIRKHTASYLYQSLLMYDLVEESKLESIMNILQDTEWDRDLKEVREIRGKVCNMFGISPPKAITT